MVTHSDVVDTAGLANELKCSETTVKKYMSMGMPSFKMGRLRRFRVARCIRWLEARSERDIAATRASARKACRSAKAVQ